MRAVWVHPLPVRKRSGSGVEGRGGAEKREMAGGGGRETAFGGSRLTQTHFLHTLLGGEGRLFLPLLEFRMKVRKPPLTRSPQTIFPSSPLPLLPPAISLPPALFTPNSLPRSSALSQGPQGNSNPGQTFLDLCSWQALRQMNGDRWVQLPLSGVLFFNNF